MTATRRGLHEPRPAFLPELPSRFFPSLSLFSLLFRFSPTARFRLARGFRDCMA